MLILVLGLVSPGCQVWTEANRAQTQACLASVSGAFLEHPTEGGIKLAPGHSWTRLSDDNAQALLSGIARNSRISECGRWTGSEPLLDGWQNRVLVDVKDGGDGRIQFRVWSRGPDGREGTSDDVSSSGFGPVVP
jgi:hypothetical protein